MKKLEINKKLFLFVIYFLLLNYIKSQIGTLFRYESEEMTMDNCFGGSNTDRILLSCHKKGSANSRSCLLSLQGNKLCKVIAQFVKGLAPL